MLQEAPALTPATLSLSTLGGMFPKLCVTPKPDTKQDNGSFRSH